MPMETSIQVRVSFEQKARIEERAKAQGMRPATFMRDLALYGGMEVEDIPYETPQETLDRHQKATEDDPSNLNVTLDDEGALVAKEPEKPMAYESPPEEVEAVVPEDDWIRIRAKELVAGGKANSVTVARPMARQEWDELD